MSLSVEDLEVGATANFEKVYRDELQWLVQRRKELRQLGWISTDDAQLDENLVPAADDNLRAVQTKVLDGDLTGLAISGGGIRSATFALGVLQQLAAVGMLSRFDYLSTVSGGGYIGSWLSAWIHREGLDTVQEKIKPPRHRDLSADDDVEEHPIRHLRRYSNYLAPVPSLFSFDGWVLVAIYLRNLILNQIILILAVLGVVIATRCAIEIYTIVHNAESGAVPLFFAIIGVVSGGIAVFGSARLARADNSAPEQSQYWVKAVIPWVITAIAFTLVIVSPTWSTNAPAFWKIYLAFGPLVVGLSTWMGWISGRNREKAIRAGIAGFIGGAIGGVIICGAIYMLSRVGTLQSIGTEEYSAYVALTSTVGVPSLILLLVATSFLHVGLAGDHLSELEREWWSGVNSRLMMIAAGWFCLFGVVVAGPWLAGKIITGDWFEWIVGSSWIGTVLAGVWAGGSQSTGGEESKTRELLAKLAPVLFLGTLVILIATIATWLSYDIYARVKGDLDEMYIHRIDNLFSDLDDSKMGWAVIALAVTVVLLFAASRKLGDRVGVNTFSLQSLYANRLTRCYLGASNRNRDPQPIVNLDPNDDLPIHLLRSRPEAISDETDPSFMSPPSPTGPYHLVNTALNRKAGDHGRCVRDEDAATEKQRDESLALLERKAESFVFSPLYCGSESTGYSNSTAYGNGISLGTAVALSGAAVSPNMGYHTSAPIRILLTMFNVRLGGWYGNPRHAKSIASWNPAASWQLLLSELAGQTGVDDEFIYLSDGGHFENMGVYELIRRRCRFIVAIDSGPDPRFHDNVGRLVCQARIDFGVRVEIDVDAITPNERGDVAQHFVIGRIHYGDVNSSKKNRQSDVNEFSYDNDQGMIVWIKSGVTGDEAGDVATYRASNPDFPYQSTIDQFFSESQFEAYRELGEHSIRALYRGVALDDGQSDTSDSTDSSCESTVDQQTCPDLSSVSTQKLFESLYRRWNPNQAESSPK